jgi:hypothetical protein
MSNIEHFPDWHATVAESSEQLVAAATQSLLEKMPRIAASAPRPGAQHIAALPEGALVHRNWSFTTRRVDRARAKTLLTGDLQPQVGDLVLARIDHLGHHGNLQLIDGRRRRLFIGDLVIAAYANRYACEQFEAEVPQSLAPCHLVAGGGIAARALSWHDRISRGPTTIQPLGLLGDERGHRLNVSDFALTPVACAPATTPTVFAVLGTAMDAGKTETAAHLLRGLKSAGRRAGYIKITGTGAGGDSWLLQDAGADSVLDFTDAGLPSTYQVPVPRIEKAMQVLIDNMAAEGIDSIVMEVADGVYQQETARLIRTATFERFVSGIVLAARDAMGASAGIQALATQPRPIIALSGLLSASPLQRREAKSATGIDSLNREELASVAVATRLLAAVDQVVPLELAQ